ncbi:hypothetical protein MTO96_050804, partial [Rhipicephalus appendiculatus]
MAEHSMMSHVSQVSEMSVATEPEEEKE